MKRTVIIAALLAMLLPSAAEAARVMATYTPVWNLASEVARGGMEVGLLVPGGSDPHHYALRPGDMRELGSVELLVMNGAGLEQPLRAALGRAKKTLNTSLGLGLIPHNPHVWLDPIRAAAMVRAIAEGLSKADPPHAELYYANASAMTSRLSELHAYAEKTLAPYKGAVLVTYHDAFAYFALIYGLRPYALAGAEGESPLPLRLKEIYDMARRGEIKALFSESNPPEQALRSLASTFDLKICPLDPLAFKADGFGYYIKGMMDNIDTIERCLSGDVHE